MKVERSAVLHICSVAVVSFNVDKSRPQLGRLESNEQRDGEGRVVVGDIDEDCNAFGDECTGEEIYRKCEEWYGRENSSGKRRRHLEAEPRRLLPAALAKRPVHIYLRCLRQLHHGAVDTRSLGASWKWVRPFAKHSILTTVCNGDHPPRTTSGTMTSTVLKKYYPGGLVGHDKEGCPLWIIPFGYTDIKGLFYSVKKSDFIRHIIQQLEYSAQDMAAQSEKLGKVIEMHSFIFDLENFNLKQIAWKPAHPPPPPSLGAPTQVGTGGPVPCSCYTAPSRRLSSDQNLKMCVVEKKSAVPLTVEVAEAGSILRWEFQTENYDIGFGVFFMPDSNGAVDGGGDGMQELVAMQRVNCHLVPEDGMLVCNTPGKYVLKFDNSFSWYRSKKLLYHYQVLPPTPA
ncbi:hypothetical protein HPB48_025548 [Haemaphysalis longicornis]|uniref:GOLD domain-containing protein n=1 Tax=Haemaphysalis longicornis TaxID=44386 RepID=A0A9J6H9Q4_HAELO|nr:hypothetical protein HPB48_025548 [Haemaphysalis longicornis]